MSTPISTPAECTPLPKDSYGAPATGAINYASVVGMFLYLCGHSHPDIAFAVHQCDCYTLNPQHSHEVALKCIGRYLKGTQDKGMILRPSFDANKHIGIDCYPDADFAGLWHHEDSQDPHCVRSRTGYVICIANCPILWVSKLQSEISLSTMEAEYVTLSNACKDLFFIIDKTIELGSKLGLPVNNKTKFYVHIPEDNVGALTLGRLEPQRMMPRSKHYAVKNHWFHKQIAPRNVELHKIASK